jgi:hypothetical protein
MRETLYEVSEEFVAKIVRAWDRATPSQKVNAHKNIHPTGSAAYNAMMVEWLAEIATVAIKDVRKELPKDVRDVRLSEFDRLPKKVQKKIKVQSKLIVDTQFADLEKAVYWKFQSNAEAVMGSAQLLEEELNTAADLFIESGSISAAAGNAAGAIVNEARNAAFFDDEVLEEVESFTFVNGDPVSEICQDLAGRTFSKDDAEAERYFPPLHHNALITGTMIRTNIGLIPIESLGVGESVLTHKGRFQPITEWMDRFEDKEYFQIELDNGKKINITAEHPVLTKRGWVQVGSLLFSDEIMCEEDLPNSI